MPKIAVMVEEHEVDLALSDEASAPAVSLERGAELIRAHARSLPNFPGVYRMLDGNGDVLYVGKARDLKKRVATYAHVQKLSNRLRRMVAETRSLEVVSTHLIEEPGRTHQGGPHREAISSSENDAVDEPGDDSDQQ